MTAFQSDSPRQTFLQRIRQPVRSRFAPAPATLKQMLVDRPARHDQGRSDQGHRARLRPLHAQHHRPAQPHVRHAARPRGHPRARRFARRRDGRDRRRGRGHAAVQDHARPAGREAAGRDRLRVDGPHHRGAAALERRTASSSSPRASSSSSTKPTAYTRTPSSSCSTRNATRSP